MEGDKPALSYRTARVHILYIVQAIKEGLRCTLGTRRGDRDDSVIDLLPILSHSDH